MIQKSDLFAIQILCLIFGFKRKNTRKSKRTFYPESKIALSDARQPTAPSSLRVGWSLPFSAVVLEGDSWMLWPRGLARQRASSTCKRKMLRVNDFERSRPMVECSSVSQVIFLFILFPVIVANLRRLVYEALKTIRHASVFNSHVPFEAAA